MRLPPSKRSSEHSIRRHSSAVREASLQFSKITITMLLEALIMHKLPLLNEISAANSHSKYSKATTMHRSKRDHLGMFSDPLLVKTTSIRCTRTMMGDSSVDSVRVEVVRLCETQVEMLSRLDRKSMDLVKWVSSSPLIKNRSRLSNKMSTIVNFSNRCKSNRQRRRCKKTRWQGMT
jgi:hypothetical protein